MLDNEFNPILIHFSEATINELNNNFNKDLYDLGIILAKLITSGKFKSIKFSPKFKKYIIKINGMAGSLTKIIEESSFWKKIEILNKIEISEKFKNFFDILIKSNNELDIDELLNNEWIKDINDNKTEIDLDFKKRLNEIYDKIIEYKKIDKYQINIPSVLHQKKEEKESIFYKEYKEEKKMNNDYLERDLSKEKKKKSKKKICKESEDEEEMDEEVKYKRKKKKEKESPINAYKENKKEKKRSFEDLERDNSEEDKKKFKKKPSKESEDEEEIDENIQKRKKKKKRKNKRNKLKNGNGEIQVIYNEPKDIQFNYIVINISGNDNYCKNVLTNYINILKNSIKNLNNSSYEIKIEFSEKFLSFKVILEEIPNDDSDEEDYLLYEDIEKNDLIPLILKIEIFQLKTQIAVSYNKYYLMINYIQGDIADFYEYLKIIKKIAVSIEI